MALYLEQINNVWSSWREHKFFPYKILYGPHSKYNPPKIIPTFECSDGEIIYTFNLCNSSREA